MEVETVVNCMMKSATDEKKKENVNKLFVLPFVKKNKRCQEISKFYMKLQIQKKRYKK
jgi:hypothetical protein